MRNRRILFCLQSLGTGGSERLVLEIAKSIDRGRFTPFVATLEGGTLEPEFAKHGISVLCMEKKPGVDLYLISKLARFIRNTKIDIVNAHHFSPFFYSYLASRVCSGVRLVHTEHTVNEFEQIPSKWVWLFRSMMRTVDMNVGISRAISDRFMAVKGMSSAKVHTIINGIDFDRFDGCGDAVSRKSLGIPEEGMVIGMFANFREQKNHRNLLDAFKLVLDEMPGTSLILAGEGALLQDMKERATMLDICDNVHFLGPRLDVPRLYPLLDVYCLPSYYEGLPLTLLEAMACGICVIATDVPGNNEVVLHGENGLLIPSEDPSALAGAIIKVLRDRGLRYALSMAGKALVRQDYGIAEMMTKYELLFESILDGDHRRN